MLSRLYDNEEMFEKYLSGKYGGGKTLCQKFGIRSRTQLFRWLKLYRKDPELLKVDGIGFQKQQEKTRNVGIGLEVCKTIIEAHKGQLFIENRQEGGARVSFSLPLANLEIEEKEMDYEI